MSYEKRKPKIVVPDFDPPDAQPKKPVIPDFDLPITKRTPYQRGVAIGTTSTRHPRSSQGPRTKRHAAVSKEPELDHEQIQAEIAKIRREKELLHKLGKT